MVTRVAVLAAAITTALAPSALAAEYDVVAHSPGATLESGEVLGGQFVELRNTGAAPWTDVLLAGDPISRATALNAPTDPGDVGRFDFSVTGPVVTQPTTVHGAFTASSASGGWTGPAVGIDYTVLPAEPPRIGFVPDGFQSGAVTTLKYKVTDNVAVARVEITYGSQHATATTGGDDIYSASFTGEYCPEIIVAAYDRAGLTSGFSVHPSCPARDAPIKPPPPYFAPKRVAGELKALWSTGRLGSRARSLTVRGAPAGAKITVTCRGCTFKHRTLTAAGAKTNLLPLLKHHRLRPGSVLEVRIAAGSGSIASVTRYRIRSHRAPAVAKLCLAPGATTPGACG